MHFCRFLKICKAFFTTRGKFDAPVIIYSLSSKSNWFCPYKLLAGMFSIVMEH